MALDYSALLSLLSQLKDTDLTDRVRTALERVYQELIDAEAAEMIGALPHERSSDRSTYRNGSRPRLLTSQAGDLELRIPKLRQGSFFPALLERRRRVDEALYAVVMEAYVHGVSTRKVDDLVRALGADSGISKSEVSRICADLDGDAQAFRHRDLSESAFPYVFLDATYCKARVDGKVVSQAVVVAFGVRADGHREILGVDVGHSETESFWTQFLASLTDRGLHGVHLVISDAHKGLKTAIQVTLQGTTWQRCRVHFLRNALATLPAGRQEMIASLIRTIFSQPDAEYVHTQHAEVVRMLERIHPKTAELLAEAKEDLLAFTSFPRAHWRQIWSTNPLERLNREIKRRTDGVGVFPNPEALLRLTTMVLIEQHDEWAATNRRYLAEGSLRALTHPAELDEEVTRQLNIA
jgi:transposase-like protein